MAMTKVQGWYNLAEKASCFLWSQSTLSDQVVEQFSSTHMLKNQISAHNCTTKNTRTDFEDVVLTSENEVPVNWDTYSWRLNEMQ